MNLYIFEKASETAIRAIWIETDPEHGYKSVSNIMEMSFDSSKASLKNTIKCLYEMLFVGEQPSDLNGYKVEVPHKDYDTSLAGKARKQSSKDINVITEQLWSVII
jgi:hypothetical protein